MKVHVCPSRHQPAPTEPGTDSQRASAGPQEHRNKEQRPGISRGQTSALRTFIERTPNWPASPIKGQQSDLLRASGNLSVFRLLPAFLPSPTKALRPATRTVTGSPQVVALLPWSATISPQAILSHQPRHHPTPLKTLFPASKGNAWPPDARFAANTKLALSRLEGGLTPGIGGKLPFTPLVEERRETPTMLPTRLGTPCLPSHR